jgi:hypothetical protein
LRSHAAPVQRLSSLCRPTCRAGVSGRTRPCARSFPPDRSLRARPLRSRLRGGRQGLVRGRSHCALLPSLSFG